ncbi:MAG: response regulator transcription factor [Pseudomonadota bacterium]
MDRTLLIEDHPETQDWLTRIITQAFPATQVTIASQVTEARSWIARASFSRAIIDLNLPDGDGIEIVELLARDYPDTPSVVATVFDDEARIVMALSAGTSGYVLKDQSEKALVRVLRGLEHGEPPLSPTVARHILQVFRSEDFAPADLAEDTVTDDLTPRELEVLEIIARGAIKKDVANSLRISEHTVSSHVKSIYTKLGISSRAEASLVAHKIGLLRT